MSFPGARCIVQSADAVSRRLDATLSTRTTQLGRQWPPAAAQRHQKAAKSGQSGPVRQPDRPAARPAGQTAVAAAPEYRRQYCHAVADQLRQTAAKSRGALSTL